MRIETNPLINNYADAGFSISGQFHGGSVLITRQEEGFAIHDWMRPDASLEETLGIDDLGVEDFAVIFNLSIRPDLILFGAGEVLTHSFARLRVAMTEAGIPIEVQTTPAICRTWNLLLSEGRNIALAALAVGDASKPLTVTAPNNE